jgi:MFS transporter, DHA2 family, glioxin efflux transporter
MRPISYGTYLPLYFQIVDGVSALDSGIRFIPFLLAIMLPAIAVGLVVPKVGFYNPFMIGGSILACIGSGLLYTLQVGSNMGQWLGYQVITGLGIGV